MTLITTLMNTQNGNLVESEYGHRFFIDPSDETYLGMLPSDEITNSDEALHFCKCETCGTAYVTQRKLAASCPKCTKTVAPLVGEDEIAWVEFTQMQSLYGTYRIASQVVAANGQVLAHHDTFDNDEVIIFEDEMYTHLIDELQFAIETAVSLGLKPTDGSGLRLILAPCDHESEERVLQAWEGPAWYGFAWQWFGNSGNGEGEHWSCGTQEAYCETLADLATLVKGWGSDNNDLLWVGKLGYELS